MKCTVFSVQVSLLVGINQIWPEKQANLQESILIGCVPPASRQ